METSNKDNLSQIEIALEIALGHTRGSVTLTAIL